MLRRVTILLGCVVCLLVMSAPAFAAANDCDRACLKTALEQYMNAVTMHKPSAAPLFAGFQANRKCGCCSAGRRHVEVGHGSRESAAEIS